MGLFDAVTKPFEVASNAFEKVTDSVPFGGILKNVVPGGNLLSQLGNLDEIIKDPMKALTLAASFYPGASAVMPIIQGFANGGGFDFNSIAGALTGKGGPFEGVTAAIPSELRQAAGMLDANGNATGMDVLSMLGKVGGLEDPMKILTAALAASGQDPTLLSLGSKAGEIGQGIAGLPDQAKLKQILDVLAPLFNQGGANKQPLV